MDLTEKQFEDDIAEYLTTEECDFLEARNVAQ